MRMKTDGIIFDVDGTLWDSTEIVAGAWNQAIEEEEITGVHLTGEILKGLFGKPMDVIARNILPEAPEEQRERIMERCCLYEYEALSAYEGDITFPGVAAVMRKLAEKYPLFIVSNCQSGYIELFLEKTGLADTVTDMECYGNTKCSKGENIRSVVERNGLNSPVYVGDTLGDYEACEVAKVPMIFAAYGFGGAPDAAAKVGQFQELLEILAE